MTRFWMDGEDDQQWTLQDIYDDLGSHTDVAAMLDVTVWRMRRWLERRERVKCPEPLMKIGATYVYSRQEWRDWYSRWCADPRRAKWLESSKVNGAGLPFFAHSGPDRGWPTRVLLQKARAAAATGAETTE